MASLRTTNTLLAVIAVCLVCLTAKSLIPEAHAQPNSAGNTLVSACFIRSDGRCESRTLLVDQQGNLLVKTGK